MSSVSDKKLFTPGPLNTSMKTKTAMLRDLGSRDSDFMNLIKNVRSDLLKVAGVNPDGWTSVLLQGSGTFAVEAVIQTAVPRNDPRVLVLANGAYGLRIASMCRVLDIPCDVISGSEIMPFDVTQVESQLTGSMTYSLVAIVQCETSSGVINNVEEVANMVRKHQPNAVLFVDAMSSFGAIPLDFSNLDFVVSSANKCLQGVPGFAYALARKECLDKCKGNSRSLSLDLAAQEENLLKSGQFRFTFPTHTLLAFQQAMAEFWHEGGVEGRAARYKKNNTILVSGMRTMGFKTLVPVENASNIITCFMYPSHANFDFQEFYTRLSDKGQVIYPGKITEASCFRIGNIGDLHPQDIELLLRCISETLDAMNIEIPVQ